MRAFQSPSQLWVIFVKHPVALALKLARMSLEGLRKTGLNLRHNLHMFLDILELTANARNENLVKQAI